MRVDVVLVPLTVRCGVAGEPPPWLTGQVTSSRAAALMLGRRGGWIEAPVRSGIPPHRTAAEMIGDLVAGLWESGLLKRPDPKQVGFVEEDRGQRIRLVYTIPVPISASDIPPTDGTAWVNLHHNSPGDEIRDLVRDHWRQALEETTGGLDLLPRYFTMRQLADLYSAIWDSDRLDFTWFKNWVTETNAGMVRLVDITDVEQRSAAALGSALGGRSAAPLAAGAGTLGKAGIAMAGGPLALLASTSLGATLGAAAGAVAYRPTHRGRAPKHWYTRNDGGSPRYLRNLYQPRPQWMQSGLSDEVRRLSDTPRGASPT